MKQINRWHINIDQNGAPRTADFGPDDFERWWLAGMDRTDPLDVADRAELLDAMIDLAEAESREMVQSVDQLRDAIDQWADRWNVAGQPPAGEMR